jgi:hypothetical protein
MLARYAARTSAHAAVSPASTAALCAAASAAAAAAAGILSRLQEMQLEPSAVGSTFYSTAAAAAAGILSRLQEMQLDPRQLQHIPLTYFATITGAWTTRDPQVLQQLDPLHVHTEEFLETRCAVVTCIRCTNPVMTAYHAALESAVALAVVRSLVASPHAIQCVKAK